MELFEIEETPHDTFEVADEVSYCLSAALNEIGVSIDTQRDHPVTGFYPDNIRVNKLSFMATDKFDLPLIRTWYKYGQYEPYESIRADSISSSSISNRNKIVYDPPHRRPVTRDAIYSYFLSITDLIDTIWEYDLYEFMIFNYGRFAPKGLKDLYIANTGILKTLERMYHGSYESSSDWDEFKKSTMNLRYELTHSDMLSEGVVESLLVFLTKFENAVREYDRTTNPSESQRRFIRSSMPVYHTVIWNAPSLEIAISNMDGPDDDVEEYRDRLRGHIPGATETLEEKIGNWEDAIEEAGLFPKRTSPISSSPELGVLAQASTNPKSNVGK